MTEPMDEAALRNWLVDYLVTNIGCNPEEVDVEASMNDLGVGSRDAVVLSGELSELLGRTVSPVEFWQHPTIDSLARFLTGAEADGDEGTVFDPTLGTLNEPIAVIGVGCRLPGGIRARKRCGSCSPRAATRWARCPPSAGRRSTTAPTTRPRRWRPPPGGVRSWTRSTPSTRSSSDLPARGRQDGPAAAHAVEVDMGGAGERGNPGDQPASLADGRVRRRQSERVRLSGFHGSASVDAWSNSGGALSIIANRLSYILDLPRTLGHRGHGLFLVSLVALHLACQSLRTQDCDVAIAGGVNLLLSPAVFRGFDQSGALSKTGACHCLTPTPTASSAARVAAWWCSNACPTRCATGTGRWP